VAEMGSLNETQAKAHGIRCVAKHRELRTMDLDALAQHRHKPMAPMLEFLRASNVKHPAIQAASADLQTIVQAMKGRLHHHLPRVAYNDDEWELASTTLDASRVPTLAMVHVAVDASLRSGVPPEAASWKRAGANFDQDCFTFAKRCADRKLIRVLDVARPAQDVVVVRGSCNDTKKHSFECHFDLVSGRVVHWTCDCNTYCDECSGCKSKKGSCSCVPSRKPPYCRHVCGAWLAVRDRSMTRGVEEETSKESKLVVDDDAPLFPALLLAASGR
jgi:hypothetical protein